MTIQENQNNTKTKNKNKISNVLYIFFKTNNISKKKKSPNDTIDY